MFRSEAGCQLMPYLRQDHNTLTTSSHRLSISERCLCSTSTASAFDPVVASLPAYSCAEASSGSAQTSCGAVQGMLMPCVVVHSYMVWIKKES